MIRRRSPQPPLLRGASWAGAPYGAALASVLAVAVAQNSLSGVLEGRAPFTLLLVAVCFSSWIGGLGPGLFAMVAACGAASYLFAAPRFSLHVSDRDDLVGLALYLAVGCAVLYFGERHRADRRRLEEREAEIRAANDRLRELNDSLEGRVAERTAELQASNDLLATFSYSIAHDLRSALLAIVANVGLLRHEHGEGLSEEASAVLERANDGCRRVSRVVDELLAHARLGQRPIVRSAVDLSAVAEEEAERLGLSSWPASSVEFRVQPGIVVQGDHALLSILIQSLLENACKFSRRGEAQTVELFQTEDGTVTVRDGGVGFDLRYVHKLFRPFERLHPEYPGLGMGLANAARIVERHGGRIWADGREGAGAAFSFSFSPASLLREAVDPNPATAA